MTTEYLAITAIFLAGFYAGIKVRTISFKLENYFKNHRSSKN